jgi:C4-dicarboxylate-specific signal transduction histidine kinase
LASFFTSSLVIEMAGFFGFFSSEYVVPADKLSVKGLVAGVLVSERRLAEARLRMNQNALSDLSRLGSMGEFAATIAQEANQPLSAARTYTGLVAESLQTESLRDASTVEMANKAAVQIGRAADVVRRLRALVRMGRSDLVPTRVTRIVQEAADLARTDLQPLNVTLKVDVAEPLCQQSEPRASPQVHGSRPCPARPLRRRAAPG